MKLTLPLTLSLLHSTLASTHSLSNFPPTPTIIERQNLNQVPGAAVVTAATQQPSITTYMIAGPGGVGQIPVTYTQIFTKYPGQLPSPGVGSVGLGTLKVSARTVGLEQEEEEKKRALETGVAGRVRLGRGDQKRRMREG